MFFHSAAWLQGASKPGRCNNSLGMAGAQRVSITSHYVLHYCSTAEHSCMLMQRKAALVCVLQANPSACCDKVRCGMGQEPQKSVVHEQLPVQPGSCQLLTTLLQWALWRERVTPCQHTRHFAHHSTVPAHWHVMQHSTAPCNASVAMQSCLLALPRPLSRLLFHWIRNL